MATSRTKLAAALRAKFKNPRDVLKALGVPRSALDADLVDVGKPVASGSADLDQLQQFRAAIEENLSGHDDERFVARMLAICDEFAPTDRADPEDPNASRPAELVGNDDDNLAQVRAMLKKAGLSDADVDTALRLAAGGGNASDVLPTSGPGGLGGAVTGRTRSPGERVFAADERRRAAQQLAYDKTFPNAVVVAAGYAPDRERDRPRSWPSEAAIENYNRRFGGAHIG